MSTTKWTHPVTEIEYPIGTEGWQFSDGSGPNNVLDSARDYTLAAIRIIFPGLGVIPTMIAGAIAGDGAWCPTYGLWAGPGWAGGVRIPSEESGQINWGERPCFNENVKISDNPESCYSVVDAITKYHDWEYTLAEDKKAAGIFNETQYKEALLAADVTMLQNIESAVKNGFYESPTWVKNEDPRLAIRQTVEIHSYAALSACAVLCIADRRCSPRRCGVHEKYASLLRLCAPCL